MASGWDQEYDLGMFCDLNYKLSWRCTRGYHFDGPCALVPQWWNLLARWRTREMV